MATLLCLPLNARTPIWDPNKLEDVHFHSARKLPRGVVSGKLIVKEKNRPGLGGRRIHLCNGARRNSPSTTTSGGSVTELDDNLRKLLQTVLWIAEGVYVVWLFLLPYAPVRPLSMELYFYSQYLLSDYIRLSIICKFFKIII